jgi:hypothetical protein
VRAAPSCRSAAEPGTATAAIAKAPRRPHPPRHPGRRQPPRGAARSPTAVVPYLVTRDHFTERLYYQRTGYWQPDLRGLEPATGAEHAAALDLLAGGSDEQFAAAAATLIGHGDHALALEIIQPGLLRHPASITLAGLRRTALHRSWRPTSSSTRSSSSSTPSSPEPRSAPSNSRPPHAGARYPKGSS